MVASRRVDTNVNVQVFFKCGLKKLENLKIGFSFVDFKTVSQYTIDIIKSIIGYILWEKLDISM